MGPVGAEPFVASTYMRVLLVATSNKRRGAEVFTERLRDGLLQSGIETSAVCLTDSREEARADLKPVTSIQPAKLGRLSIRALVGLRRAISSSKPDVIVAMGGPTLRYAVLARIGTDARLAYVAIGEPRYWLRSETRVAINRALLKRTDLVLAVSRATMEQILSIEPTLEGRVRVAHTGVPDSFFDVTSRGSDGPLRIVMIGSLSHEKDPALALEAMVAVEDSVIRFVGSGPLELELREQAEVLGIADRVSFAGSVEDVRYYFAWADVLLLTSLTEGLPGVILEAAASSLPSVAVDVGGVSEAVVDGETGLVVSRNVDEIAGALSTLRDNRERLRTMGEAARNRIRSHFSMDGAVRLYAEALSELAP